MKFLSICFTITVNQIATSFKKFKNLKKLQLYIRCFNQFYLFLCLHLLIFSVRLFSILLPLPIAICSNSFKQSRHHLVLMLYGWYCGPSFEALILSSSFDSCGSFLCFLWLTDFLLFEYLVLSFVSDMP